MDEDVSADNCVEGLAGFVREKVGNFAADVAVARRRDSCLRGFNCGDVQVEAEKRAVRPDEASSDKRHFTDAAPQLEHAQSSGNPDAA